MFCNLVFIQCSLERDSKGHMLFISLGRSYSLIGNGLFSNSRISSIVKESEERASSWASTSSTVSLGNNQLFLGSSCPLMNRTLLMDEQIEVFKKAIGFITFLCIFAHLNWVL